MNLEVNEGNLNQMTVHIYRVVCKHDGRKYYGQAKYTNMKAAKKEVKNYKKICGKEWNVRPKFIEAVVVRRALRVGVQGVLESDTEERCK